MPKLIGYRKFAGKKDATKMYCVATITSEPTDRECLNGFVGLKADNIYLPEHQVDMLKPEYLGRELKLDYSVSNGRAFLNNVIILDKK